MTLKNPKLKLNSNEVDKVYVIKVLNYGILKLKTKGKDGRVYTYYLSQTQILKVIE